MFKLDEFIKHLKTNKIKGATQAEIGKAIGRPQAYVSQISTGERPFLKEYLKPLSEAYGENNVVQFYVDENSENNDIACNQKTEASVPASVFMSTIDLLNESHRKAMAEKDEQLRDMYRKVGRLEHELQLFTSQKQTALGEGNASNVAKERTGTDGG